MQGRTRIIGGLSATLPSLKQKWYSSDYPVGTELAWQSGVGLRLFPTTYSKITDVVGNRGGNNPVTQQSFYSSATNFSPWKRNGLVDTAHVLFEGIWLPLNSFSADFGEARAWTPVFSAATLSDWSLDAFNKFHDQVPTTVSLANFMYELKDMKGMIPSINRTSLTKTASNNFLAWEFGVKPFISDIKAIISLTDDVDKRIKHLIEQNQKSSDLSFNRSQVYEDPLTHYLSIHDPNAGSGSQMDLEFKRLNAKSTFHAGAKLYQDLSDLSSSISMLKALTASGGFNHPARIIWNAIPYSFVVDWFFHVGKLLDSLTVQPFGGTYSVSDTSYSIKSEAMYKITQVHNNDTPADNLFNRFELGYLSCKSYIRRNGLPLSSVFLTDLTLSPTQLALSAAMLNQRRG